jgi:AcrR family transcriptional regulator
MPQDVGRPGDNDPPTRKRRPPLVTRNQVIEVAYGLVSQEGPSGLSMRKLASALHVSLPTVYTAIDSREGLVDDLQDRLLQEIADAIGLRHAERGERGERGDDTDGGEPPDGERADVVDLTTRSTPSGEAGSVGVDLHDRGRALLDWSRRQPHLTEFLLEEQVSAALAERAVRSADEDRRAAAGALVEALVGPTRAAEVDPVTAVAAVLAEGRAALWLARQDRLAAVDAEHWIGLGCDNVANALTLLATANRVGTG